MNMFELKKDQKAIITKLNFEDKAMRYKILSMGITVGSEVRVVSENKNKNLFSFFANNIEFTTRPEVAKQVEVKING